MNKIITIAAILVPLSQSDIQNSNNNYFSSSNFYIKLKPSLHPLVKSTALQNFLSKEDKTTDSLKQNSWYNNIVNSIKESEYNFTWQKNINAYCTPNRNNNLRFIYTKNGFTVQPRTTWASKDVVYKNKNPKNWQININLDKKQVDTNGRWQVQNNKAEYITNDIVVQYINNKEGMRQNFIIQTPLNNSNEISINLEIKTGLKIVLENNQLRFFSNNKNVLNYTDLKIWDANGKKLKAFFKKNKKNNYQITTETKNAVYPITIDPLSTTPAVTLSDANQANSNFGNSVASAGDINGDGFSDVIVGAILYDNGVDVNEGRAFVYNGSITGLSSTPNQILDDANQAEAQFGISVASAGDVNNDGYSDVIVGANTYDEGGIINEGRVYIYHGSAIGLSSSAVTILDDGNTFAVQYGNSVASAGDVNGDGFSDVIVGCAYFTDGPNNLEGRVFLYHGSASGVSSTPTTVLADANQIDAQFGSSVACAGDINGDGFSDVIIGAEFYDEKTVDEGAAFIYYGSAIGIAPGTATILADSNSPASWYGQSVSSAGDVNGDGYSDVIIGAFLYNWGPPNYIEGAAFVYYGSATGIASSPNIILDDANENVATFGISVACAGDINADGYADVIIGSMYLDDGANTDEGKTFLYYGSAIGLNDNPNIILADANQPNSNFGSAVSSAGDVNGDGYSDVIVGAVRFDNGANTDEGRAYVYYGSANGVSNGANIEISENQPNSNYGISVSSASDVNGDGFSDVIVGASLYDNGQADEGVAFIYYGSNLGINTTSSTILQANQAGAQMGYCVNNAGDVNGDGYGDIIVGAPHYSNGQSLEGAAFIYYGSATGINAALFTMLESNQANAKFGTSVSCAGNVNIGGFGDVIIGAPQYSNGESLEGAAYVYHGSITGINTTAFIVLESNQANALFGTSVSGAGDVNGDGFSDVIVGAIQYTSGQANEGAAFVYHGSSLGISFVATNIIESNQAAANMGASVATAGDVNGDGFSDVIIGANLYDSNEIDEGAAFVYKGSATGINTLLFTTLESNQVGANMGVSVASAGDINGDGYSDVIIGANLYDNNELDEGVTFVYQGSATGISNTPNLLLEYNQASSNMATSLATAGDVNGDGYSDVTIGANLYNNGIPLQGIAFIYNGNDSVTNKRNNLKLYNTDLLTPLNNSNFIFGNFGARFYAKSFLGRDKGKMVWETRINYNAYSGNPITNSTFFSAQQPTYTDLGVNGVELKAIITKILGGRFTKLRARVKYKLTTAITGQVYGPWRNVSSIIDANQLGVLPIDLVSFNAKWLQKGSKARIDFITDNETGICCFDIEKSLDGVSFFSIDSIPAKNINTRQSYVLIDDKAINRKQFYRLKIKSSHGQVQYSGVQQLQTDNTEIHIVVFPNPAKDLLQIQLNNSFDKITIQIVNNIGQIVKRFNSNFPSQKINLPIQDLASGIYWLHLQGNNKNQVIQFIKQ